MLVGAVPALLTLFIRLFVPESEKWKREKEAGAASHWAGRDLIGVLIGAARGARASIALWAVDRDLPSGVRVVGSLVGLVVVIARLPYPARGYLPRSGLPPTARARDARPDAARRRAERRAAARHLGRADVDVHVGRQAARRRRAGRAGRVMQMSSSLGAASGAWSARCSAACFGRRPVYAALCVLSLVVDGRVLPAEHRVRHGVRAVGGAARDDLGVVLRLAAAVPAGTVPTAVRATGQGFGFNFGRIIAAAGNLQMANLLARSTTTTRRRVRRGRRVLGRAWS